MAQTTTASKTALDVCPGKALAYIEQTAGVLFHHWPGLHIGNHVMRAYGATSWRFGAADYLGAVRDAPRPAQLLGGSAVEASWDNALTTAMREHGVAIAEEALAAALLPDLDA